jgi:hypothetical protein
MCSQPEMRLELAEDRRSLDRRPIFGARADEKPAAPLGVERGSVARRQHARQAELQEVVAVALSPQHDDEIERVRERNPHRRPSLVRALGRGQYRVLPAVAMRGQSPGIEREICSMARMLTLKTKVQKWFILTAKIIRTSAIVAARMGWLNLHHAP